MPTHYYVTPTIREPYPWGEHGLFRYYLQTEGVTWYKVGGVWNQTNYPSDDLVADEIYHGGKEYEVSSTKYTELTALGFSGRTEVKGALTVPSNIDATGATDVGAALTDWLNTIPEGGVADLGTGTYLAQSFIKPTLKKNVTIRGGTLKRTVQTVVWPAVNPHLWLLNTVGTRVENLKVRGTNTVADQQAGYGSYLQDYEFEAAIRAEGTTGLFITGLDVDAVWGDGVQLQTGSGATIEASVIDRCGRQGVTIIASNVRISTTSVLHGRRSGFDLEPDTVNQLVRNIEIERCYARTIGLPFASAGAGVVSDVYIHDNVSDGASVPVLYVDSSDGSRRSNWNFERHRSISTLGSPSPAVNLTDVDGAVVRDNVLPVVTTQSQKGVTLTRCGGHVIIRGNNFAPGAGYITNTDPRPNAKIEIL